MGLPGEGIASAKALRKHFRRRVHRASEDLEGPVSTLRSFQNVVNRVLTFKNILTAN